MAWGFLILLGGSVVLMLVGMLVGTTSSVAKEGWYSPELLFPVIIVIYVVGFFSVAWATHPIRGRGVERRAWKERFPTQTDQEVERFIAVAGDELGLNKDRWCRLRPDDRVAALTQEWMCGDGMDIIEFSMAVEEEYGLELPESFHERDRTLGDFFAYVTQHGAAKPPPSAPKQPAPTEDA